MNPIDLHSDRLIKGGFDRIPGMVGNKKFHQTGAFFWPYKAKSQFYNTLIPQHFDLTLFISS